MSALWNDERVIEDDGVIVKDLDGMLRDILEDYVQNGFFTFARITKPDGRHLAEPLTIEFGLPEPADDIVTTRTLRSMVEEYVGDWDGEPGVVARLRKEIGDIAQWLDECPTS